MKADRETFIERINVLGRDALLTLAVSLYDKMEEMRLQHLENDRISTEAHIQFSELHEKYTAVLSENEELKVLLQKEIEKNTLVVVKAFCNINDRKISAMSIYSTVSLTTSL